MQTKRIFLASSAELKTDRDQFEIFIARKNKEWHAKGVALDLVNWEDFLDAMSHTRLQDEYNKAIRGCDMFVMLFWTKVGKYTEEEFEHAFKQFQSTSKPFVFTYFKDGRSQAGSVNDDDLMSLLAFKKKLKALGHFFTRYENIDGLNLHFSQQLDKLVANGFIEFKPDKGDDQPAATLQRQPHRQRRHRARNGADGGGAGGVLIGGNNAGSINTGTQVNTGGGAYVGGNVTAGGDFVGRDRVTHVYGDQFHRRQRLWHRERHRPRGSRQRHPGHFAARAGAAVRSLAGRASRNMRRPDKQAAAVQQVQELKAEVAKGKQADDGKLGGSSKAWWTWCRARSGRWSACSPRRSSAASSGR